MSFLRHEEIYRSDVSPAIAGSGNSWSPSQRSSAAMSFQSAIPWRVALRQSPPPLHRLVPILNNPLCRTMIFQRTATTPLTSCLSLRVHSKFPAPVLQSRDMAGAAGGRAQPNQFIGLCASCCRERTKFGRLTRKMTLISIHGVHIFGVNQDERAGAGFSTIQHSTSD
jgi:hypothetical protein